VRAAHPCPPYRLGHRLVYAADTPGIGLEAAHQLAALKPQKLILTARSTASGATAVQAVLARAPGTDVDCWELDLEKYATVKAFAERAGKELPRVDLVMSNAA
jgi:NAD(P)-dependent dehydrogenase (short-subunit alcohol dehydrogenase family)